MARSTGNAYKDEVAARGEDAGPRLEDDEPTYRINDRGFLSSTNDAQDVEVGGPAVTDAFDADTLGNTASGQPLGPRTSQEDPNN